MEYEIPVQTVVALHGFICRKFLFILSIWLLTRPILSSTTFCGAYTRYYRETHFQQWVDKKPQKFSREKKVIANYFRAQKDVYI